MHEFSTEIVEWRTILSEGWNCDSHTSERFFWTFHPLSTGYQTPVVSLDVIGHCEPHRIIGNRFFRSKIPK